MSSEPLSQIIASYASTPPPIGTNHGVMRTAQGTSEAPGKRTTGNPFFSILHLSVRVVGSGAHSMSPKGVVRAIGSAALAD